MCVALVPFNPIADFGGKNEIKSESSEDNKPLIGACASIRPCANSPLAHHGNAANLEDKNEIFYSGN